MSELLALSVSVAVLGGAHLGMGVIYRYGP